MNDTTIVTSADLAAELERKYFWWETVGSQPRSEARILTQAMDLASFADIRRLEDVVGRERLVQLMRQAEPGWLSEKSWEFWRGRLSAATGQAIPELPPGRSLHAAAP
jgi:hypothetical protein